MRTFLILWLVPIFLLGTWYGLASNDLSFGMHLFSRETHDAVFAIYGKILGIEPDVLPGLVAQAIAFDSLIVMAVIAFIKRRPLIAFLTGRARSASSAGGSTDALNIPAE